MSKVRKNFLDKLAFFISSLGSPFIVLSLMFLVLAWHYKESIPQFYSYIFVTGIFVILIPLAYMLENVKDFSIADLHLSKKADREKVLIATVISAITAYFMLYFIGVPRPLLLIEIVGIINLLVISLLTFRLKVSIHLATVTVAATLLVYFLGTSYVWIYLLLFPMAWARYRREKHTLIEILAGISISLATTLLIIKIL